MPRVVGLAEHTFIKQQIMQFSAHCREAAARLRVATDLRAIQQLLEEPVDRTDPAMRHVLKRHADYRSVILTADNRVAALVDGLIQSLQRGDKEASKAYSSAQKLFLPVLRGQWLSLYKRLDAACGQYANQARQGHHERPRPNCF